MFAAPIYWCYECWQHQYQPIQVCLPRGDSWSVQFMADFFTIINYRTPCFLYGDWYGSTPTPSPVSKGRDQWELRGGVILLTLIGWNKFFKKDDITILIWFGKSANNNCKRNGAANEKYFRKRSASNICSTTPIWSNDAYSICWSKRKWK